MKKKVEVETIFPMVLVSWYDAKDGESGWKSLEEIKKRKTSTMSFNGVASI